jgi:hypothetical protein
VLGLVVSCVSWLQHRFAHDPVNEFYKKGCQEKSSASTGGREDFGLEIQPTAVSVPPDSFERFLLWLVGRSLGTPSSGDDDTNRVLRLGQATQCQSPD